MHFDVAQFGDNAFIILDL